MYGWELALYSLVAIFATTKIMDLFYIQQYKLTVTIFTKKEKVVSDYIIKEIHRGCTVFHGKGGYTGQDNCVILTILTRSQFIKLKQFIKENDSKDTGTAIVIPDNYSDSFLLSFYVLKFFSSLLKNQKNQ